MGMKRSRFDSDSFVRKKATRYLLTACALLFGLAGVRLFQLARAGWRMDARVVVLEGAGTADVWFELERVIDDSGDVPRFRLTGSSTAATISSVTGTRRQDGLLEEGSMLAIGPLRYRLELAGSAATAPTLYRWPLAEISPAPTLRAETPGSASGPGGGRPARTASTTGWRRLDIGGDPSGQSGVRDRLYIPWERVAAALPAEVVKARGDDTGVAMILPRDGDQFRADDQVFRVAAEVPGMAVVRPDGSRAEVPVVKATPGPSATLPALSSGDRLEGPGFALWFDLEAAVTSEPVLDDEKRIVAYRPKVMRYLTFREVAATPPVSIIGGGARLVAVGRASVPTGAPGSSVPAVPPAGSGGPVTSPGFVPESGGEGGDTAFSLTGGDRFLFIGKDRLLGRFASGPVPARLPDREFLRLAREAFDTGVLYEDRGFLEVLDQRALDAVAALEAVEGAPVRDADGEALRTFAASIAAGQGAGADDRALRDHAGTLVSRWIWESPARSWGLAPVAREAAIDLLKALGRTSGAELETMLETYNAAVLPAGLWVAGRLEAEGGGAIDPGALEGWEAVTADGGGLADEGAGWAPAMPGEGVSIPPMVPPDIAGPSMRGRWRAPSRPWRPGHTPPGARITHRYRRSLDLEAPAQGVVAFAAPGYLRLQIDGVIRYQGPGMGPEQQPGVVLPIALTAGRHLLEATTVVVIPERYWSGRVGLRLEVDDGGPLRLSDARGAGWLLPGWEEDSSLGRVLRLWRPLVGDPTPAAGDPSPQPPPPQGEGVGGRGPEEEGASEEVRGPEEGSASEEGGAWDDDAWALSWEEASLLELPDEGEEVTDGDVAGDVAAATEGTGKAEDGRAALDRWLWLEEPAARTAAGGIRYLVLVLEAEPPGPRTLRLTTTALPRSASWNGSPLEVSAWSASPPSIPLTFVVQAGAGRSILRLELDQPPAPARRVADPPVVFREGRPVGFKPQAVTRRRPPAGTGRFRAPIVDADGRSRPALVVERGFGPLEVDQEILLGEHRGKGDTTLLFPGAEGGRRTLFELDGLEVSYDPVPKPDAPGPVSFVPARPVAFYRQVDARKPPFLPIGGFRVAAGQREWFRDDRDQLDLGDRRLEYVSVHRSLVSGDVAVIGTDRIDALRIDPLPETGQDEGLRVDGGLEEQSTALGTGRGRTGAEAGGAGTGRAATGTGAGTGGAAAGTGQGEALRLIAGKDGVTCSYRGALEGAMLYRPGQASQALAPGDAPASLVNGDRIALPRSRVVFRYVERQGVLAPALPEAEAAGYRTAPSLGLETLIGDASGASGGIEQVFDAPLSGGTGAPARLGLTLDDDLQRYAREQLLRQLELLRRLGPAAVEDEDGAHRPAAQEAVEGAVILLDARTGGILAAVSETGVDRADPASIRGERGRLLTWQDLRCHPGSTFKLVTSLAALESPDPLIRAQVRGRMPPGLELTGGYNLMGATLPGLEAADPPIGLKVGLRNHKGHGVPEGTTLPRALESSLNTYFGYLSLLMHRPTRARWGEAGVVGDETYATLFPLYGAARRFGFDAPIDLVPPTLRAVLARQQLWRQAPRIDALGRTVARGDVLVASPSRFPRVPLNPAEVANVGIGQGEVYATPLQMAMVASVYATGGVRFAPHLVEALGGAPRDDRARVPWTRVTDAEDAVERVREGMKAVVATGSAAGAFADSPLSPHIYGKTGTAERPARGGGTVDDAWFVGYIVPPRPDASAPDASRHELAFACQIPAAGLGGRHAAEVIDRLLRDVARYYGWTYRTRPLP